MWTRATVHKASSATRALVSLVRWWIRPVIFINEIAPYIPLSLAARIAPPRLPVLGYDNGDVPAAAAQRVPAGPLD